MTLKQRLLLVSAIFIIIATTVGIIGLVNIKNISANADELSKEWLPAVQEINALANDVALFRVAELQYAFSDDSLNREKYMMEMTTIRKRIGLELDKYNKDNSKAKQELLSVELNAYWSRYLENHMRVMQLGEQGKPQDALSIIRSDQQQIYENMVKILNQMTEANNDMVSRITTRNYSLQSSTNRQIFLVIFLSFIICLLTSFWLFKSILTPVKQLTAVANVLAQGDFSINPQMRRNDEIGVFAVTFAKMVDYIKRIIGQINATNAQLASYSEKLAKEAVLQRNVVLLIDDNVAKVTSMAEKQTESMSEGSKRLNEEVERSKDLAQWSKKISNNSHEVTAQAEGGIDNLNEVLSATANLNQSVINTIDTMNKLKQESAKISEITIIITEIAQKIKLVSLNASIQAASAGQHGTSFKVVAEEIGSLAIQSTNAVNEISNMILSIQNEINRSVNTFAHSQSQVGQVNDLIKMLNQSFNTIVQQIKETDQTLKSISESAQNSSVSTFELGNKINIVFESSIEMVASCQQIAASTEEQILSINELVSMSEKLSEVVQESIDLISNVKT